MGQSSPTPPSRVPIQTKAGVQWVPFEPTSGGRSSWFTEAMMWFVAISLIIGFLMDPLGFLGALSGG